MHNASRVGLILRDWMGKKIIYSYFSIFHQWIITNRRGKETLDCVKNFSINYSIFETLMV